jgi:hypothetical protein
LLAHGGWFSPGTLSSSTTTISRHDIADLLLKVALNHQESNQINRIVGSGFLKKNVMASSPVYCVLKYICNI